MSASEKIGVVLFNLGGPTSLDAVKPFLYNLFQDPDIFTFPHASLIRKPLAYLIASLRAPKSRVYFEYMGGKSPITELTLKQAKALEEALNNPPLRVRGGQGALEQLNSNDHNSSQPPLILRGGETRYKVVVAMRYWHPNTEEAIGTLLEEKIDRVLLLPLYPQYSYTTTRSSYREWKSRCGKKGVKFKGEFLISSYYDHPLYIQAVVKRIQKAMERFPERERENIHLLFSAHGIPVKEVQMGDPYEDQIEKSVSLILKGLGTRFSYSLSYQSKVGPLAWLEPTTADTIKRLAQEGIKNVVAIPISFVSDHSETLYELKKLYGDLSISLGMRQYELMPALNDSETFIEALKDLVLKSESRL